MADQKSVEKDKSKGKIIPISKVHEDQNGSIIHQMIKTLTEIEVKIDDHLDSKKEKHDHK